MPLWNESTSTLPLDAFLKPKHACSVKPEVPKSWTLEMDYSRAPCLGADQRTRGLWERDCSNLNCTVAYNRNYIRIPFRDNDYQYCRHWLLNVDKKPSLTKKRGEHKIRNEHWGKRQSWPHIQPFDWLWYRHWRSLDQNFFISLAYKNNYQAFFSCITTSTCKAITIHSIHCGDVTETKSQFSLGSRDPKLIDRGKMSRSRN